MNNKYTIKVESPLLRTGLSIQTEVSSNYVVEATNEIMNLVRKFNESLKQVSKESLEEYYQKNTNQK